MPCVIPYLLRTQRQIDAFRERHADLIRDKGPALAEWFNRLPLYEWKRLQCRPGQEEAMTGLLCHLYLTGEINITFSRDGEYIQRGVLKDDEYQDWAREHFRKPRSAIHFDELKKK